MTDDRNFDDLAHRFKRNIYGGLKRQVRLQLLRRDLAEYLPLALSNKVAEADWCWARIESSATLPAAEAGASLNRPWRILDAGGGQGQFSLELARAGHNITLCDISAEMLKLAQQQVDAQGLSERVQLKQCSIQELAEQQTGEYDLVICHAVLEWVAEPQALLQSLQTLMKPGAYLSLTFYNLQAMIYKNLLRTNFKKIQRKQFRGYKGSLTPTCPLEPEQVYSWLQAMPLQILCRSGIRVFHDYIFNGDDRERDPENLLAMELEFSRQEPYRSLGRYIHVLAKSKS